MSRWSSAPIKRCNLMGRAAEIIPVIQMAITIKLAIFSLSAMMVIMIKWPYPILNLVGFPLFYKAPIDGLSFVSVAFDSIF